MCVLGTAQERVGNLRWQNIFDDGLRSSGRSRTDKGEHMNIASDTGGYDFAVGGDGPLWADVGRRGPSGLAQIWAPKTS